MNYIKIIEDTLGVELSEKALRNYEPNPYRLRDLAENFKAAYSSFKMPEKNIDLFRPYISPRFELGDKATLSYRSKVNRPDKLTSYPMEETAKKLLLYAHEICLHDPMVYLLDYYTLGPESQHSKDRLPTIAHILTELSRLKPLIERNLIHIISDELFDGINDWSLLMQFREFQPLVAEQLGSKNLDEIVFDEMMKSLFEQAKLENDIDLYFPTDDFSKQYSGLLKAFNDKFVSSQIKNPLLVGELGGLQLIDANRLSVEDIIHVREEEKVFEQWRLLVKETLQELSNTKDNFSDAENEFKKVLNEQYQKLDLDILKQAGKSAFYSNVPKFKEKVGIALFSFGVTHSMLPPDLVSSTGSLINTLFSAVLEQGNTLFNSKYSKNARKALNKHMLVLK